MIIISILRKVSIRLVRLETNNELLQKYNNIIKEQLKLNDAEKVPPSETNNSDQVGNIHYLQHHP